MCDRHAVGFGVLHCRIVQSGYIRDCDVQPVGRVVMVAIFSNRLGIKSANRYRPLREEMDKVSTQGGGGSNSARHLGERELMAHDCKPGNRSPSP